MTKCPVCPGRARIQVAPLGALVVMTVQLAPPSVLRETVVPT